MSRDPHPAQLRQELVQALDAAFPEGVVEMPWVEDSYLSEILPQLRAELGGIGGASLLYERDPEGGPGWGMSQHRYEEDDDPSAWDDFSYSYYLFFLSSKGDGFEYEAAAEYPDEEGVLRSVDGSGRLGLSVAASLIAPFAVVAASGLEHFEDGSISEPGIDRHLREVSSEASWPPPEMDRLLENLRGEITRVLGGFDIEVLPAEELRRAVPWLEAGEEVFSGLPGQAMTVQEAFFFEGL